MSRDRGIRLQNALAAYLTRWWPHAESAGSGRPGSDVLGTPGVVWECKTAAKFSPSEFVRQAKAHAKLDGLDEITSAIPVVVYYPPGVGEANIANVLTIMPLHVLMRLLIQADYTPCVPDLITQLELLAKEES